MFMAVAFQEAPEFISQWDEETEGYDVEKCATYMHYKHAENWMKITLSTSTFRSVRNTGTSQQRLHAGMASMLSDPKSKYFEE